jgi:tetratricopeptide (TPR) repeat protein/peroxiredoxin
LGSPVLSQPGKKTPVDLRRRDFLIRCCQSASAALIPASLGQFAFPAYVAASDLESFTSGEFHLHPRYRTPRPLDALLQKAKAGSDEFISEKYADQIDAILARWSAALRKSPQNLGSVRDALAPDFSGASLRPAQSQTVRSGSIAVRRNTFSHQSTIAREAFLGDLESVLNSFTHILTAEFQITGIEVASTSQLKTRVRYELVGAGADIHRQQRVGHWTLTWEISGDTFLLRTWQPLDETESRSQRPVYTEVTAAALGGNSSYTEQLLRGTDYWRSVLDGACGIDIYGHNGVSIGDIDGNGLDDLYVCQPGGLPNRLYRNRGDGTFEDITESAGVGVIENTACALFVDVDNDGRQDLVVVRAGGPLLFLNQGGGKFRRKADAFQFAQSPQGTFVGAAVADYDRDGWLDIYFALYTYYQGAEQYKYPSPYYAAENGPPNFLMRNQRDGTFRDVTRDTGLDKNNTRYSFCCGWSDFNGDGWPDLYVVNDFGRKNLYRNNGDGTFTDIAAEAGVEDIGAGMSVCCFDYDNDGAQDLYVANMWTAAGERITVQDIFKKDSPQPVRDLYHRHAMGNSLYRNGGQGEAFVDETMRSGAGNGRWAWSSDAWDFDHDGFPDLYIVNGMVSGPSNEDLNSFFWRQVVAYSPDQAKPSHMYEQGWSAINELIRSDGTWSGYERNVFYGNNGDGTFSDISGAVGLDFVEDGRSFALADFDGDGRQELFLKNRNAPQLRILKNVLEDLPPAIAFRLRGTKSNRDAIGAAVTIETDAGRQTRLLQAGSGFLSQHSKELFFGLGRATGLVRASIRWPSGAVQELRELPINHRIWVEEGAKPSRIEAFRISSVRPHIPAPPPRPSAQERHRWPDAELPATIETWLLAPVSAPDFSLTDLAGRTQALSALRGTALLLNFWTTQSTECMVDLDTFNRNAKSWSAKRLQLLTVNVDDEANKESLQSFNSQHRYSFPILRGNDETAGIYNILYRQLFDRHRDLGLPTSFLISGKGEIVKVYQGSVNPDHVEQDFQHIPQTARERMARALPFPGIAEIVEFGRNYLSFGAIFFQRGYLDQAEAAFRIALRDDPTNAEALYGIGSVCLNQQRNTEARENFERAVKLTATYPDTLPNAWNNLGILATREGRMDEAISHFQEALRHSPDSMIALDNLGSAFRQTRRWKEAQGTYDQALKTKSDDPDANYGMGMVYAENDDTTHAEEYLQRALKLRPEYPEALNNLGILYLRTHRRDRAVASFEESIRVAPDFDQSYLNLARVHAIEGDREKARAVLRELLQRHPDNATARHMLTELEQ